MFPAGARIGASPDSSLFMDCIFCKIANKDIPAKIVAESANAVAFRDLNPQAPTHVLVIPRTHVEKVSDLTAQNAHLVADCMLLANQVAAQEGITSAGYRVVTNCGAGAGQSVWHLHFHVLGGRAMTWPPG
jgi:histidine triad (HIT) family protein